jgi:hypothetical protein
MIDGGSTPADAYSEATKTQMREEAARMTQLLRTGQETRWRNLRDQLEKVGIAAQDAALANLGPDDYKMEAGLIVTRSRRCFLFTLDWSTTEDGESEGNYDDAWIWDWRETDRGELRGHEAASAEAADVLLRAAGASEES